MENELLTTNEILEKILEEGTKKFAKAAPEDRRLYGLSEGDKDLLAFCRYMDPDFTAWRHTKQIAEALEKVQRGEIKRLIINMPPRFGKSHIASKLFPAWYRGRHPKAEIIQASYSASRAQSFSRAVRDYCETEDYAKIFPDVQVRPDKRAAGEWLTTAGGVHIGSGVGGGITGAGAHLAVIDDPVKDYEEAVSPVIQDKIWDWYRSVLHTRLYPASAVVVIMTRWVSDDLAGRLIEQDGLDTHGGKWHLVKLPVLLENGESLWPEMYSLKEIQGIREAVGEKIFSALYQQEPVDTAFRLFGDPIFGEVPEDKKRSVKEIAYLDPAFGGDDYSALAIGCIIRGEKPEDSLAYVTGGYIWQGQIDVTYDRVEKLCKAHNVAKIVIEGNQAQKIIAYELRRRGFLVDIVTNSANKHLRIVNEVKVNWQNIRFTTAVEEKFLRQVTDYSELAEHDDAPDALSGLVKALGLRRRELGKRYGVLANLFSRRFR